MKRWGGSLVVVLALVGSLALAAVGERSVHPDAETPLDGYRVVYRVEDRTVRPVRIGTQIVEVIRPYDGRIEVRTGPPPGMQTVTGQVTNRRFFWQLYVGGELQFGIRRVPGGPLRDASYGVLLEAARRNTIRMTGKGDIRGRSCTWFAFANPAPQRLYAPNRQSRFETCVDTSGIVLSEVWQVNGRPARVVEAVTVSRRPPARGDFLYGKDPGSETVRQPEAAALLKRQLVVDDDAEVDAPIELRSPAGWRRDRSAVASQATGTSSATQIVSETFVRGRELVIVERGTDPSLRAAWPADEGEPVEVGRLGDWKLVYFLDRVELRMTGVSGVVRIAAPSLRVGLTFARGLRQAER